MIITYLSITKRGNNQIRKNGNADNIKTFYDQIEETRIKYCSRFTENGFCTGKTRDGLRKTLIYYANRNECIEQYRTSDTVCTFRDGICIYF